MAILSMQELLLPLLPVRLPQLLLPRVRMLGHPKLPDRSVRPVHLYVHEAMYVCMYMRLLCIYARGQSTTSLVGATRSIQHLLHAYMQYNFELSPQLWFATELNCGSRVSIGSDGGIQVHHLLQLQLQAAPLRPLRHLVALLPLPLPLDQPQQALQHLVTCLCPVIVTFIHE